MRGEEGEWRRCEGMGGGRGCEGRGGDVREGGGDGRGEGSV